jgi:mono/diheme cytochrome c family protein
MAKDVLRAALLTWLFAATLANAAVQGDPKRGEYLAKAGGCAGCHTGEQKNAVPFAGGRALKTPFGTFYGPNITPDAEAGIGRWSEVDFVRAMRLGERPDGANFFPAFPYPSFTKISDGDLRDLWAYLRTLPPSAQASKDHDLWFIFGWRWLVSVWKWFFFTPGPFASIPGVSEIANRGAYLVQALGHCGECHTPRNFLGGPKSSRYLAGGKGPDGKNVANLTPTGLKKWDDKELKEFLTTGLTPDGDVPAESMGEVITNTTSKLLPADLDAVVAYLRTLAPLPKE